MLLSAVADALSRLLIVPLISLASFTKLPEDKFHLKFKDFFNFSLF